VQLTGRARPTTPETSGVLRRLKGKEGLTVVDARGRRSEPHSLAAIGLCRSDKTKERDPPRRIPFPLAAALVDRTGGRFYDRTVDQTFAGTPS
jgi:hypothetical protein